MLRVPIREAIDTGQPLSAVELEGIRAQFGAREGYADTLILLSADAADHISTAATWLLKNFLETGGSLASVQVERLIERLPAVTARGAQLHVCQSVRFLEIPPNYAASLLVWLRPLRSSKHPFLRAWSIDATCEMALQRPNAMPEARNVLEAALSDPSASVKARARAIARKFGDT